MTTVFDDIAARTLNWVEGSWRLNVRVGEETLSDILALQLEEARVPWARLFQTTKQKEAKQGTDLEILVRQSNGHGFFFAVQAKKLYEPQTYKTLGSLNKNPAQIDLLEQHAVAIRAIPLYLMFNGMQHVPKPQAAWSCGHPFDSRQLGCTLVPSWRVRQAMNLVGKRKFDFLHQSAAALPWRCVLACSCKKPNDGRWASYGQRLKSDLGAYQDAIAGQRKILQGPGYSNLQFDATERGYEWPDWLWTRDNPILLRDDFDRLVGAVNSDNLAEPIRPTGRLLIDESRRAAS